MKNRNSLLFAVIILLIGQILTLSCAVDRVRYSEEIEIEGILARIIMLDSRDLSELVISMQKPGHRIRERVFLVNWEPDSVEIDDYNDDSMLDILVISTNNEPHYFYSTEQSFVDF